MVWNLVGKDDNIAYAHTGELTLFCNPPTRLVDTLAALKPPQILVHLGELFDSAPSTF
jgi:hypothetical protein